LRDLGYVDGQTITIDYLTADGHGERFPMLTAECLRFSSANANPLQSSSP
jgi:putative ABC transport system substrate-binding protein